ncbi:MAG: D-glycerate dehydrogenase [Novosphingobium sp.]|nr:D-glycerate dehydrogenase [Novosphingobium sp.]
MTVVTDPSTAHRIAGKPRVIVTRKLLPATESRMQELFDVTLNQSDEPMDRDALILAMQDCDVFVPTVTDRIDAEMIGHSGDRLGLIANFGAGYEHIDLAAARARKIKVTNTPSVFTDDTADLTLALIIMVSRRFAPAIRQLHDGQWKGWAPSGLLGHSLGGKLLAIVGMGRIGQAVAHRARAFGMDIAYHNRNRLPQASENMLSARYEPDLDALVANADILSLHCPATEETHHMINAARIASMKPEAYVVNTARGQLIDEDALVEALSQGRLGGAGLDVYSREPAIDRRLLDLPNVSAIPHLGSATFEGREQAGDKVIANIRFWADGHRPPDQVLQAWE